MENKSLVVLKRRSEFLALKTTGKKIWVSNWLFLLYSNNSLGCLRYGVTASNRVCNAVIRNKLKRWCRVYLRDWSMTGQQLEIDVNFIFKTTASKSFFKNLKYKEFKRDLDKSFKFGRKSN